MNKEEIIQEFRNRILKAKKDIKFCENEIDILSGLTEECPHCKGEGRFMTVHRMFGNHSYSNCIICHGKGKITKEELEIYNKEYS